MAAHRNECSPVLGNDRNLALILGTYKPDIACRGAFPSWRSCRDVMAEMPVSTETQIFGPAIDPDAQVVVPHFIESGKSSDCIWKINRFLTKTFVEMTGSA